MHPLEQLEFSTRVAKRAQYEAFEFSLADDGVVVRNGSHPNPSDHEYLVTVEAGVPTTCECPADANYEGACKHRVAVAIRRPLLDAVTAESTPVAADGGRTGAVEDSEFGEPNDSCDDQDSTDEDGDDPDCEECRPSFPCWDCVRTGRRDLPR